MANLELCRCGSVNWHHVGEAKVEDCKACGGVAWIEGETPVGDDASPLQCAACGERVFLWMNEDKATTLKRCHSCDDVVVLTS